MEMDQLSSSRPGALLGGAWLWLVLGRFWTMKRSSFSIPTLHGKDFCSPIILKEIWGRKCRCQRTWRCTELRSETGSWSLTEQYLSLTSKTVNHLQSYEGISSHPGTPDREQWQLRLTEPKPAKRLPPSHTHPRGFLRWKKRPVWIHHHASLTGRPT